jgi:hypothetical protein
LSWRDILTIGTGHLPEVTTEAGPLLLEPRTQIVSESHTMDASRRVPSVPKGSIDGASPLGDTRPGEGHEERGHT